jgi:hypothetical protein
MLEATQQELQNQTPILVTMKAQISALEEELRARHSVFANQEEILREHLRPHVQKLEIELQNAIDKHTQQVIPMLTNVSQHEKNQDQDQDKGKGKEDTKELQCQLELCQKELKQLVVAKREVQLAVDSVMKENMKLKLSAATTISSSKSPTLVNSNSSSGNSTNSANSANSANEGSSMDFIRSEDVKKQCHPSTMDSLVVPILRKGRR